MKPGLIDPFAHTGAKSHGTGQLRRKRSKELDTHRDVGTSQEQSFDPGHTQLSSRMFSEACAAWDTTEIPSRTWVSRASGHPDSGRKGSLNRHKQTIYIYIY